jgi:uncharacterized protein (TIGR02118 family)
LLQTDVVQRKRREGTVKYVVLLKRRPELDRETFRRLWQEEHLPLIRTLPGLRQVELNLTTEVANYPPQFDGVGILWFDSVDAALAAFQSPQGQTVRQHTPTFADSAAAIRMFATSLEEQ